MQQGTSTLDAPVEQGARPTADIGRRKTDPPLRDGITLRPDSASGHLPGWVRSRLTTTAAGVTTQSLRMALPTFFGLATQTAAYKYENDDATFLDRLGDGTVIAGLFDGVTVPKRNNRAGHA